VEEVKAPEIPDTMVFPNYGWFVKWKETLLLGNIKVACQHTYNKAMALRNQMIEIDSSYAAAN